MSFASVVCCQVEASATGRSLAQRSPIECGVPGCNLETSTVKRPRPTGGCRSIKESDITSEKENG
jgi:hypothetical protein